MQTLTILTLVLVSVIVATAAWHLVSIAIDLRRTGDALEALAAGLIAVRDNTAPLKSKVSDVNAGLEELHARMQAVRQGLGAISDVVAPPRG